MFEFHGSPAPVRDDLRGAFVALWNHFARPGPSLTGSQRIALLTSARAEDAADASGAGVADEIVDLATTLLQSPRDVDGDLVRRAADATGDPVTVEAIGLSSMLAAVDGCHRALSVPLEELPDPVDGPPSGIIAEGLKRRRTHVPVPPGPIPVVLDLLPEEGRVFQVSFGPQYMTSAEMHTERFERSPGLDRAQMEIVASRTSLLNECFY